MRTLRGLLAAAGLAIAMAGCDLLDRQYFQSGIGTGLYMSDIAAATQLQDVYLGELCRQSLPTFSRALVTECSNSWSLIVEAGMNDIDQRCDSYLSWLSDKRRTNAAIIKQFGDIAWATQNIMNITGASADPIAIVGTAFGLATNTFTNVNSRLLFVVDRTAVQTLVLNRRNDYRKSMAQIAIASRPASIHALRSYLTICTPFAIETDINSTVTVFQQGGAKGNLGTHLHNGDPLNARTAQEPAGRPAGGSPPFTWIESATDALKSKGLHKIDKDAWSIEHIAYELERYNGFGYRNKHPNVKSPYLWSCTNQYTRGKYVGDHKFDANAVSAQVGTMALLKQLMANGVVSPKGQSTLPPPSPLQPARASADRFVLSRHAAVRPACRSARRCYARPAHDDRHTRQETGQGRRSLMESRGKRSGRIETRRIRARAVADSADRAVAFRREGFHPDGPRCRPTLWNECAFLARTRRDGNWHGEHSGRGRRGRIRSGRTD